MGGINILYFIFFFNNRDIPDLHNTVDYVELQEVVDRKELFETLLQEVIQDREVREIRKRIYFLFLLLICIKFLLCFIESIAGRNKQDRIGSRCQPNQSENGLL
jgi:hypothetical protein